ncbi:MAG TPA: carboxypeptidase-like regulatory domain-containing protein, partial [Thermoanaerobaculia bacterium]|nr:carboxypeptidase-like regulatory domain-containing protein [Thermoanaerobaculia bacterium]
TLISTALFAQQTGSISGKVTASDKSALPGVTVEARSNVLPQPRVSTTDTNGDYTLPALIPGQYTVTYTLSGMQTATRRADVLLRQTTTLDVTLGVAGVSESITVTAEATLVNRESTVLQNGLTNKQITELPLTQDYRDLQKLVPGVVVTEDAVRGPSAGGSGQDNVYLFDGANVTMPLFGVLNADPNNHDIAQVTYVRGGAKATDFIRAGGLQIDTVSKSGTNKLNGELSYQTRRHTFVADKVATTNLQYDEDRNWYTLNLGGPIIADRLFFYGSYYRPVFKRDNQANLYGALPSYERKRNEEFGKVTYTPIAAWLINGSYRHSHTLETSGDAFGSFRPATTGSGSETYLKLGVLESSYVIGPKSLATFKYTDYRNPGFGQADFISGAVIGLTPGTHLDITNLAVQGRLVVPTPIPGNAAQTAFVTPFINQYGYVCPDNPTSLGLSCVAGQRTGGGTVGFGQYARDDDSFFRKAGQLGYNYTFGANVAHDLHLGVQRNKDSEDRFQLSNGWGLVAIPGGSGVTGTVCPASICGTAKNSYFTATVSQQGVRGNVPTIHSEFTSTNFEINDTLRGGNWAFNLGLLTSRDTLYGQGLARADNIAGFVTSPGTKYKMHEFGFTEMMQPRLGATWAYNGRDTVYASYARYNPPANSDARAASWDRNLVTEIKAYFDQNGDLLGVDPNASSSGKWWQEGIKHPAIAEYMVGTARQMTSRWSSRVYTRYKKGFHFMEDTNNNARVAFNPPEGIPRDLYVPNLSAITAAIGSGSSYVIANLDGAFTKYYEATAESEWRSNTVTLGGSYRWSHYYGNFDQDNSTFSSNNDAAIFIGSSNIGDGAGRQLWDFKYGDLRGDRRHLLKLNGTYTLPWHATTGAFWYYQSGQPYQLESVLPYRALTGSTSDTNRYAEPAGSRLSPSHHQLDLNYTQSFPLTHNVNLQLVADVFNIFDKQTGYNFETRVGTLGFTTRTDVPTVPIPDSIPQSVRDTLKLDPAARVNAPYPNSYYPPRRYQLSARIQF